MPIDRLGGRFYLWPNLGVALNTQWSAIRSDTAEAKALVDNSIQQLETGVDELNAARSYLGQQYGDLDFENSYRLIYVEATEEFCLQVNNGTVEVPIWNDVFCIRRHDGQFQVVSQGGIVSNAGFYNFARELHLVADSHSLGTDTDEDVSVFNTDRILFDRDSGLKVRLIDCGEHSGSPEVTFTAPFGRSQIFEASGEEWVVQHNFGFAPQMVQVMDSDDRVIIPDTIDVSDPNIAYFYFHQTVVGSVIIATGGLGAAELRPRDPFYLVVRTDTQPADTRRLRPNANLIFDHKYFYVETHEDIVDGCPGANPRAFVTILPEIFYLNDLKDVTILERPDQGHVLMYEEATGAWVNKSLGNIPFYMNDLADVIAPDPNPGDILVYNETTGFWETQAQVRAAVVHTQALAAVEWIVNHTQNTTNLIVEVWDDQQRQIFPDLVDASDPNTAYFYFVNAQVGKAVIFVTGPTITAGAHGDLSGLGGDHHTQYIRVDGTRAFTGNQSMGGSRITSLGAPVAGTDAARLQDIVTDHGGLSGLTDPEDHPQYILVDGTRAFTGNQSMGLNKITSLGAPVAGTDAARLVDVSNAVGSIFYGFTVAQSNDVEVFRNINTLKFEVANFYITQNSPNTDEVQVNLRHLPEPAQFFPVIQTSTSKSNTVVTVESETRVNLPIPATGTYHISVEGVLVCSWTEAAGGAAANVVAELEETKNSGNWSIVDSHTQGNAGGSGDDNLTHHGRATLFYDFGGPLNGSTYSYRLSATTVGVGALAAGGSNVQHRIRARLDRTG